MGVEGKDITSRKRADGEGTAMGIGNADTKRTSWIDVVKNDEGGEMYGLLSTFRIYGSSID